MSGAAEAYQPFVSAEENPPELTFRALALGSILGVVFGAASTYLALRVGLTTSASVPIAVLSIWAIRRKNNQRAILEHNIVQTAGSAGESVAAAVVFSVPALIFLGYPLHVGLTTLVALTGGVLGVLMMVPLRRYLIVKEHGVLRYPEGKACAEILAAGEKGGTTARKVFIGLGVGAVLKAFQAILGGVQGSLTKGIAFFKGAQIACDVAPELFGVGYIIGYRTSVMMVAGSLLSSFILVPMIVLFGAGLTSPLAPAVGLIRDMSPDDVWKNYVKYIGAGAVAVGGVFALVRALPSIVTSVRASALSLAGGGASASGARTDRDAPVGLLVGGAIFIVAFIWAVPAFHMNLLGAVLILLLGFLFSVVSSRITGEVGSSSCPLSGMTIGVLMATCAIFLLAGKEGASNSRLALMIGAIVCIAISNAGTCSQDLKTGFLVGSTPVRQQTALLIGVLTSVLAVGWTAYLLNLSNTREMALEKPFAVASETWKNAEDVESRTDHKEYGFVRLASSDVPAGQTEGTYLVDRATGDARYRREEGIGSKRFPAPQSRLMSVVIDGLLTHKIPWDLILLGAAIAMFMELLDIRSLTFAVGVYLPLSTTMPVFLGGLVRKLADLAYRRPADAEDETQGTLFSSGIIAGASIIGIFAAMQAFLPGYDPDTGYVSGVAVLREWFPRSLTESNAFGLCVLLLLGFVMWRGAADPKKS